MIKEKTVKKLIKLRHLKTHKCSLKLISKQLDKAQSHCFRNLTYFKAN